MYIHDSRLISYTVNLDDMKIELIIEDEEQRRGSIYFEHMLAYNFEYPLHASILLGIEKSTIEKFILENTEFLEEGKNYYWPIKYSDKEELINYLNEHELQYYIIQSSYGLNGWIVCENMTILD